MTRSVRGADTRTHATHRTSSVSSRWPRPAAARLHLDSPPSSTMENEKIYSILPPDLAQLAPWLCRWPYRPRWAFNTFVTLNVSWSPSHLSSLTRASISIWTTFSSLYVVANWTCSKSSTETQRKYAGPHHNSITINYKWVFNFLFKYCVTLLFPWQVYDYPKQEIHPCSHKYLTASS